MDFGLKELSRKRLQLFPNNHSKRKPTLLRIELHKKFEWGKQGIDLELWNKQTLLVGCERVVAGGQLSGARRQSNLKITVCFCCRSFLCPISPRNSGLWPQRPDLTGPELGRHGWDERTNSLPEGSPTARVLRWHRSANGWEAGVIEWERDTGDLKELNEAPDNLSLWRRPLPQCLCLSVLNHKQDQTESVPRLTDMG